MLSIRNAVETTFGESQRHEDETPELFARFLQSLLLTRHPSAELNRNGLKRQKSFHHFVIQIQISMDSWNWFGTVQRTLSSNKVQAGHRQRTWTGTTAPLSHFFKKIPTESLCKLHNGQAGNEASLPTCSAHYVSQITSSPDAPKIAAWMHGVPLPSSSLQERC